MDARTEAHIQFIRLINRSEDDGDGWRRVSPALEKIVRVTVLDKPSIYELDETNGMRVRLSEYGNIFANLLKE